MDGKDYIVFGQGDQNAASAVGTRRVKMPPTIEADEPAPPSAQDGASEPPPATANQSDCVNPRVKKLEDEKKHLRR